MLWEIRDAKRTNEPSRSASRVTDQHSSLLVPLTLVLIGIFPVHELGASCVSFTPDGQQLVTTGDCVIKIWSLAQASTRRHGSATQESDGDDTNQDEQHDKNAETDNDLSSLPLARERLEWDTAIPFAFSVQKTMDLLAFDDTLAELVPHHTWRDQHHARPNGERVLTLQLPLEAQRKLSASDVKAIADTSTASRFDTAESSEQREALPDDALSMELTPAIRSSVEELRPRTADSQMDHEDKSVDSVELGIDTDESSASARDADSVDQGTSSRSHDPDSGTESELSSTTPSLDTSTSSADSPSCLSLDDAAFLTQYYRDLATFDFEQLLNPTVPFRSCASTTTAIADVQAASLNDGDDSSAAQSGEATSPRSDPLPSPPPFDNMITTRQIEWRPLLPDAHGKLLTTFHDRDARGVYSAHTSRITCCAVALERDVVVTVSLDKALKFWSLSTACVLESVADAHAAPIMCCTVSTATTRQNPSADGMLVATGAKDNVVKVWRRMSAAPSPVECIYTLLGHYDGLTACAFDPTGVFLVTASDDTTVVTWRIVPSSPDQPSPLTVVAIDKFAITLSWDAPLANGSPLLHYMIRTTQVSSLVVGDHDVRDVPDTEVPAKYTSKTIEGLQPGIRYTFEIAAVNAVRPAIVSLAPPLCCLSHIRLCACVCVDADRIESL